MAILVTPLAPSRIGGYPACDHELRWSQGSRPSRSSDTDGRGMFQAIDVHCCLSDSALRSQRAPRPPFPIIREAGFGGRCSASDMG
jgi:hypothetical protein